MEISAKDVNLLRQQTGAGMMDCKKALVEAGGDFDKAIELLRKKGQKIAANREGREAKEGCVFVKTTSDSTRVALVELNCETDFVARNDDFQNLGEALSELALNNNPDDIDAFKALAMADGRPVSEHLTEAMGKIGEKIDVSKFAILEGEKVVSYIHPGARVGVAVSFSGVNTAANFDLTGRDIAMQIAAMKPIGIDKEDVPADIIQKEIEIGMELARNEGKPENMLEKIAQGKLQKFYKENTLLHQDFVKDNTKTVSQYMKDNLGENAKVLSFRRIAIGS